MTVEGKKVTTTEAVETLDLDPMKPKLFPCQFCDKKFTSRQGLGGHQNAHKRERSEGKKLRRKHLDPFPRLTSYLMSSHKQGAMSPFHFSTPSRRPAYYQSRYLSSQHSNRFGSNVAHSTLDLLANEASLAEGHENVSSTNFQMWQRYYRDKMARIEELPLVASLRIGSPLVAANSSMAGPSANEEKLDLSLHL